MYWKGHVGVATLAYAPVGAWLLATDATTAFVAGLVLAIAISTLPDVDVLLPIPHRGPTHTVWFVVACSLLAGAAGTLIAPSIGLDPASAGALFAVVTALSITSHLLADVITPMGVRPLDPVSSKAYSLDLVYSKNRRANWLSFLGGMLTLLIVYTTVTP